MQKKSSVLARLSEELFPEVSISTGDIVGVGRPCFPAAPPTLPVLPPDPAAAPPGLHMSLAQHPLQLPSAKVFYTKVQILMPAMFLCHYCFHRLTPKSHTARNLRGKTFACTGFGLSLVASQCSLPALMYTDGPEKRY